ncbi:MAG: GTPase [Candidatus Aenigmarchaeota archaeon]|nr:GTPase [Candidatus Aenigmarchaeota archaeon]
MRKNVIIMGAAGRDYHNFNMFFRDNKSYKVVAFTHAQIPYIANKFYPKVLAGKMYPKGIPIYPEDKLSKLIEKYKVEEVVLAYSDLSHIEVMEKASIVLSCGADFRLMGPKETMLKSKRFVISICASRTGAGKGPVTRRICQILRSKGINYVIIRHPMPYNDLSKMIVQRFANKDDLKDLTIEEREEYELHVEDGDTVYAGVDYEKILKEAEKEAKVIVWEGGNNDLPFIKPDLHIVVIDARRPGHELFYYPSEANLRMADVVIVNKVGTANPLDIEKVIANVESVNSKAKIIKSMMPVSVDRPEMVERRRVLLIEDGPTLTHGGLDFGAASIVAKSLGAYVINPRMQAVGSIKDAYVKYPHLGAVLPAMGYSRRQLSELEETINKVSCDTILIGTPVDLRNILNLNKPAVRVRYELKEIGEPNLEDVLKYSLRKV